jgi:predicted AAA+ superfamily ATPase
LLVDEIQKAPVLLDEIHCLIQEEQRVFGLCGSSARKVRRGRANLFGGRAVCYELLGLAAKELGQDFSISRFVNTGPLPAHYGADAPGQVLRAYVDDYLREEILQEGLTRRLSVFSDISYWRLSSGIEADLVLGSGALAIEAKGKTNITTKDFKGLINFKKNFPTVKSLIIVCLAEKARKTGDGITIMPYQEFIDSLWQGSLTVGL